MIGGWCAVVGGWCVLWWVVGVCCGGCCGVLWLVCAVVGGWCVPWWVSKFKFFLKI